MMSEIKECTYNSITLDCTADISHREQMSAVERIVTPGKTLQIKDTCQDF